MAVPTQIGFGNVPQTPMNAGGILGERPFLALASFQTASGGMPAVGRITPSGSGTPTGVAAQVSFPIGFGASYAGTGIYDITFPPFQNGSILPVVSAPSGFNAIANFLYARGDTASGVAKLQVMRSGSGPSVPINPPTGTRVDLWFWAAPQNSQNLTRF